MTRGSSHSYCWYPCPIGQLVPSKAEHSVPSSPRSHELISNRAPLVLPNLRLENLDLWNNPWPFCSSYAPSLACPDADNPEPAACSTSALAPKVSTRPDRCAPFLVHCNCPLQAFATSLPL